MNNKSARVCFTDLGALLHHTVYENEMTAASAWENGKIVFGLSVAINTFSEQKTDSWGQNAIFLQCNWQEIVYYKTANAALHTCSTCDKKRMMLHIVEASK